MSNQEATESIPKWVLIILEGTPAIFEIGSTTPPLKASKENLEKAQALARKALGTSKLENGIHELTLGAGFWLQAEMAKLQ